MPSNDPTTANTIRRHEERLARDPSSLAFAQLADVYRKTGRTGDAVTLCREGLVRYPNYTTARLILAKALAAEAQFEAALAEVRTVLDVSPNDVQCHRLAAEILRRCGDLEGAGRHLELAVRLEPGDREARWLLGLMRADPAGTTETAGVARILVDDTFITLPFGAVCLEQGLAEEAAQIFTRLLRKDPNNAEARDGLEQALRARSRRKG